MMKRIAATAAILALTASAAYAGCLGHGSKTASEGGQSVATTSPSSEKPADG